MRFTMPLFSLFKIYFTLYFWKNHLFLSSFHTENPRPTCGQGSTRDLLGKPEFTMSFEQKRKKRYCIDFLLHTISFFYIYTFIVFAREVSKAAISGLLSTFISSSGSTPSGMVILFSSSFCSCISGLRFSLL